MTTAGIDDGGLLIDEILHGPRKRCHPGGTKGRGTRGGKGRDLQVKCAVNKVEHQAIYAALAAEGAAAPGQALRIHLIRLAKQHELLPATYEES